MAVQNRETENQHIRKWCSSLSWERCSFRIFSQANLGGDDSLLLGDRLMIANSLCRVPGKRTMCERERLIENSARTGPEGIPTYAQHNRY